MKTIKFFLLELGMILFILYFFLGIIGITLSIFNQIDTSDVTVQLVIMGVYFGPVGYCALREWNLLI